jgi:hypothetical protein
MQPPYLRQTELGEGEPAAVPERCLRRIGGEQRRRGESSPQGPQTRKRLKGVVAVLYS